MMQLSELEELEQLLDEELESSQDFLVHFVDLSQGMVFLETKKFFSFFYPQAGKLIEKLRLFTQITSSLISNGYEDTR
jgi:hypothetical protein